MVLMTYRDFQEEFRAFFQQFPDVKMEENTSIIPQTHFFFPSIRLAVKLFPLDYFERNSSKPSEIQKDCQIAKKNGIHLVKIWQDEWSNQKKIIQSRLMSLIEKTERIHGRTTSVRNLSADELKSFLKKNHLQVSLNTKYKYGLEKDDIIRSIMAFSKPRSIERDNQIYRSYEMIRFANALNCTVVGGFSKLLTYFIKNHKPDDIMTYADWEWSNGAVYEKHGFQLIEITQPQIFYVDKSNGKRYYPDRLIKQLKPNQSEQEISQHYFKIFNSGNLKYLLKLK